MIIVNKHKPRGIVWIASYPRSGNTWTRAFINALVNVMRDPDFAALDVNRIEEFSASESAAAQYEPILGKPAFHATVAEIAQARPKVQAGIAAVDRLVFVKTHNAHLVDHGVPMINMAVSAGGIYVVRNPLDVAISFAHFRGVPIDQVIADMATRGFGAATDRHTVHTITSSWSEHVMSWTARPHPAMLVVKYEDMYEKPEQTFAAIARHLMLEPTAGQLDRAIGAGELRPPAGERGGNRIRRAAGDRRRTVLPRGPAGPMAGAAERGTGRTDRFGSQRCDEAFRLHAG